jgi:hypothetical protein
MLTGKAGRSFRHYAPTNDAGETGVLDYALQLEKRCRVTGLQHIRGCPERMA